MVSEDTEYVFASPKHNSGGITSYHTDQSCHKKQDSAELIELKLAKERGLSICKECSGESKARQGQGDHSLYKKLVEVGQSAKSKPE